jgi:DNA-binding transcriptional MerR regulator
MKPAFTAGEASRIAGFEKPWMLGHLEREGIFIREHASDRRHGKVRKYTFADIVVLRSINRLLRLGARPARIKQVLLTLAKIGQLKGSQRTVLARLTKLDGSIIVSNSDVYLVGSGAELVDLLHSGQLAFGFMVDLASEIRPVCSVVRKYSGVRQGHWKIDSNNLEKLCSAAGL